MHLRIKDIKIGNRFRQKLENIQSLMDSIENVGLMHPIVVNEKNELIAGRRRLEAFVRLGKESIPATRINIESLMMGELHENEQREDFTMTELVEIKRAIEKTRLGHRPKKGLNFNPFPKGKSLDLTAKMTGKSPPTIWKMEKIVEHGDQKIIDAVESGDRSVEYAYKQINIFERANTPTPDLPDGEFELIYLDPPWEYDFKMSGAPTYRTMTLEEMKEEIKPPAHKNCIMFMWATNPKLTDAFALIEHWGFTYKTNIAWVKQKEDGRLQPATGHYVFGAHELLLIATKGSPGSPPEAVRIPSVVFAPKTQKHSEKPKIFYEIIESYYPAKNKLEMFSRDRRDGWTMWGIDADK